jgi:hypothetical protein
MVIGSYAAVLHWTRRFHIEDSNFLLNFSLLGDLARAYYSIPVLEAADVGNPFRRNTAVVTCYAVIEGHLANAVRGLWKGLRHQTKGCEAWCYPAN